MEGWSLVDWLRSTTFLRIDLLNWSIAVGVAVVAFALMYGLLRLALHRAGRIAERTSNQIDDIVVDVLSFTNRGLLALASLLIGLGFLDLSARWNDRVSQLWFIALALQFALWGNRGVGIGMRHYVSRHASAGMTQVSASATLMSWGARTVLWAIVLLAVLSNMGVNITAFVASLGVGGIAVALAVQNILSDLFASLSIATDKPFEVGDFIVMGSVAGTVENVGLKTTRIRALSGEQVVISNTELLKQTINNYKRMLTRRIVFKFGVTYSTTPEQAEAIPAIVRGLVEAHPKLKFDRAHLLAFGDSSLDYEVVYTVQAPEFNVYMDAQQAINLGLMRELAKRGIDFAFPTRTVYIASPTSGGAETVLPEQRPAMRAAA